MTPHAFILLPLGLILVTFSRTWLYRFMVVSTLFSGTAILNIGSGEGASGVQVWMFFGSLWLVREAAARLMLGRLSFRRSLITPVIWISLFLFIAALSLVMPVYINGHLQIGSAILTDNSAIPLRFGARHITAWLYLAFGGLLAISIAQENSTIEKLEATGRIYLWTGVFVALWGFFQMSCSLVGVTYPAFIFNNSASPSAVGYLATFPGLDILRTSSVAVETSIMAETLLTVLPLTLPALLGISSLISIKADRYCALLIAAALIAATSSSAYAGLLFLAVGALWLAVRMKIAGSTVLIMRFLVAVLCGTGVLMLLYSNVPTLRQLLDLIVFAKASSYSALERLKTVQLASRYFSKYPILGVGWGSATSHDLLFKLLANVGLIGFVSFATIVGWISLRLYRDIKCRHDRVAMTQAAWLLALSVLTFTNLLAGFSYVLGHMWLTFGMAIGCATLARPAMAKAKKRTATAAPHLKPERSPV